MATVRITMVKAIEVEVPDGFNFALHDNLVELIEDYTEGDEFVGAPSIIRSCVVQHTKKGGDMPFGLTESELKFMAVMLRRGITRADLIAMHLTEIEAAVFIAEGLVKKAPSSIGAYPGMPTPYVLTDAGRAFAEKIPIEWWKRPEGTTVLKHQKEKTGE